MRNQKSQAILLIIFLLLLSGILIGALSVMWKSEIRTRYYGKEGMVAFYLAEAGIEQAKVWARQNLGAILPYNSGWVLGFSGGRYQFTVAQATPPNPDRRKLSGIGQTLNSSAERRIEVEIRGMLTPDPTDDGILAWSWREM